MSNKREKNEGWWKFRGIGRMERLCRLSRLGSLRKKFPKLPKFSNC